MCSFGENWFFIVKIRIKIVPFYSPRTCQMKVRKSSVDSVFLAVIYLNFDVFLSHSLWDSFGLPELNSVNRWYHFGKRTKLIKKQKENKIDGNLFFIAHLWLIRFQPCYLRNPKNIKRNLLNLLENFQWQNVVCTRISTISPHFCFQKTFFLITWIPCQIGRKEISKKYGSVYP